MRLERAVPVIQVGDVGRSIDWYVARFGFDADPFPKNPPHGFAMLRRDGAEVMLQAGTSSRPADAKEEGWISSSWPSPCAGRLRWFADRSACSTGWSSSR